MLAMPPTTTTHTSHAHNSPHIQSCPLPHAPRPQCRERDDIDSQLEMSRRVTQMLEAEKAKAVGQVRTRMDHHSMVLHHITPCISLSA